MSSFGRNDGFCGWEEKSKDDGVVAEQVLCILPIANYAMDGQAKAKTAIRQTRVILDGGSGGIVLDGEMVF